jgi:hypothetical protein
MNSPIHLLYLEKVRHALDEALGGGIAQPPLGKQPRIVSAMSIVVIRRPYSYLAPVVHLAFKGAEDVQILVDRRVQDRRRQSTPVPVDRRRRTGDRRRSSPMLDIIIDLGKSGGTRPGESDCPDTPIVWSR